MDFLNNFINNKIIPKVFTLSKEPMLYRDLMVANKLFNDGRRLEGNISGMKLSVFKNITLFVAVWHIIIVLPMMIAFHVGSTKINCHISIISAVIFTIMFFATYFIYKDFLIQRSAQLLIKKAWLNHFAHFNYEKYRFKVSTFYAKALENEIPIKKMQVHILNELVK